MVFHREHPCISCSPACLIVDNTTTGVAGGADLRGSSDQSPSSGPSSNRSTASTALESVHSGPLHAPAAPVRIATTGIPFGQGRGTAARGPNPPAPRVVSLPRPSPGMLIDWTHSNTGVLRSHYHYNITF
jgi:hypothetical protein